jgi:hypothetical protein
VRLHHVDLHLHLPADLHHVDLHLQLEHSSIALASGFVESVKIAHAKRAGSFEREEAAGSVRKAKHAAVVCSQPASQSAAGCSCLEWESI